MLIPIADIVIPRKRMRQLGDISSLMESMSSVGLLNPVVLTKEKRLVAGLHRINAAKKLGWDKIECRLIELSELEARLAEIDENLIRNELTVLERSEHLAERKEIYEAMYPETKAGTAGGKASGSSRRGEDRTNGIIPFVQDAAAKTGTSRSTVEQEVKIAKSLTPESKEAIKSSPVANRKADLVKMSRMKPAEQKKVADKIASGAKTVSQAKTQIKSEEHAESAASAAKTLDANNDNGVHLGDFRDIGATIPASSVALIFTDPPYDRESLPMFADLAMFADRVLVDGGSLVTFCGQYVLSEVIRHLETKLRYFWVACCLHTGDTAQMREYGIKVKWKPMLWFVKGDFRRDRETWIDDLVQSEQQKSHHPWQQSVVEASYFIDRLSRAEEFVVDPFCGGGTTSVAAKQLGRRWWTCDIDPTHVKTARGRVAETK